MRGCFRTIISAKLKQGRFVEMAEAISEPRCTECFRSPSLPSRENNGGSSGFYPYYEVTRKGIPTAVQVVENLRFHSSAVVGGFPRECLQMLPQSCGGNLMVFSLKFLERSRLAIDTPCSLSKAGR